MQVDFYHLTRQPVERALPRIAEKVLASGERLVVVAGEEVQRAALDRILWNYAADSFLPHALAGSDDDVEQPILIAGEMVAANGARHVALADGVWRDEALAFDRAFLFFDEDKIVVARTAWKSLEGRENVNRRYWKQDETGRWEQVA